MAQEVEPGDDVDLDGLAAFLASDRAPEGCMDLSELDGFLAGLIAAVLDLDDGGPLRERVAALDGPAWAPLLRRAAAVGALTTTGRGAISPLPTAAVLEAFLATR